MRKSVKEYRAKERRFMDFAIQAYGSAQQFANMTNGCEAAFNEYADARYFHGAADGFGQHADEAGPAYKGTDRSRMAGAWRDARNAFERACLRETFDPSFPLVRR